MIAFLQGDVIIKKEKFIILEVAGKGYKIFISQKNIKKILEAQSVKIFCFLYVRENILDLYGFLTWPERELFEILINISGVGPKAALEIASLGPLDQLEKSIEAGDEKIFAGILGIGSKKAKKILLELSGKIKSDKDLNTRPADPDDPAFNALINLGFSKKSVNDVLLKIPSGLDTEQKIKEALKILGS